MSNKKQLYSQCLLKKGNIEQTSWIPEKFAHVGKILKLKNEDDKWSNGWIVCFVGNTDEHIDSPQIAIREHRKRTGDSLPKLPKIT